MIKNHSAIGAFSRESLSETKQVLYSHSWKYFSQTKRQFVSKLILFNCMESILVSLIRTGTGYVLMLD